MGEDEIIFREDDLKAESYDVIAEYLKETAGTEKFDVNYLLGIVKSTDNLIRLYEIRESNED